MTQRQILRFDLPGILSAALVPGEKRPFVGGHPGLHCADALLISDGFPAAAVADGPERNPAAASSFLKKFDEAVRASGVRFHDRPIGDSFADVVAVVTGLMHTIDYHDSTTFSAVIAATDAAASRFIVLHTGDSLILTIKKTAGGVFQLSRTSHVLVGRAPALFQTEIIDLDPEDLVVLATDGITDLARTRGLAPVALLAADPPDPSPGAVVERIVQSTINAAVRVDDIGMICITARMLADPLRGHAGGRVILT